MIAAINTFFTGLDDLVLMAMALVLIGVLVLWQRDRASAFNLQDLLLDHKNGKASLQKTGQLVAMLVSTWVLVHETRAQRLTEWLFMAYMFAWAGSNLAGKWLETRKPKEPEQ